MIETLIRLAKFLLCLLPFLLFALLNTKANLKRQYRSRQFLMPVLTLVYCVVLMLFLNRINTLLSDLLLRLPALLDSLAARISLWFDGALAGAGSALNTLSGWLEGVLQAVNPVYLTLFVSNTVFLLAHIILKRIIVTILKAVFRSGDGLHEFCVSPFYERDEENGLWHVRDHFSQARTFLKTLYFAALLLSVAAVLLSCELYRAGLLTVPFYPVFGVIIIGEVYFFLDGLNRREMADLLTGEADAASSVSNYALLRPVLTRLFGDKLGADSTTVDNALTQIRTHDELLYQLEQDNEPMVEAYGRFMRIKTQKGLELDHNYLASGLELLRGRSILFHNPFYYDLIPYVSYPMNRVLLRHRKVLIILGRHDIEGDIETWCRSGLAAVTNVPALWSIGVLSSSPQELDVGIVTRSSVHDLALHEANSEFFREVEFVVLIEPSKLVTTAQIGLNSIVRHCRRSGRPLTFCSTDKNCDGLVDALSHILLTSLTEVSATNHHKGVSSYMCWETDGEHLQHRLLPNLSRYLGMGTELSFAALKNQVSETAWYGGEAFPVVDIHWISKQYFYDLLHYAGLPASQEAMDEYFKVSPNLWDAKVKKNHYLTVEDEACNMFELRRTFATRAQEQGFLNIISPEYLLKDYMLDNNSIFSADPKAIPYIVADYAPTPRNVVLRLCLRMSTGSVSEEELRQQLMLLDIDAADLPASLWHEICQCCAALGRLVVDRDGSECLAALCGGTEVLFSPATLRVKRKFSMERGVMENLYSITDERFISLLLGDLQNAVYIAEDEKGDQQYLGSELRGHVFQKYLPGQFFTFGGKYYEMLRVTLRGQVLVRRAADHITGRPAYRQVRRYHLSHITDCSAMGDQMDIAGLRLTRQTADIRVETPAYYQMDRYNDFAGARKVLVNAVPERVYSAKQVLRIDLPDADGRLNGEICGTIALLCNEVFRTLFAENHAYIAAVVPGEAEVPCTYSLFTEDGSVGNENCIYIIEDSQLDLGLLVAVQRNLNRIFSILCDYLDWHMGALERSLNPPPEPEKPDFTVDPDDVQEEPTGIFGRIRKKVASFFQAVGRFFGKLFRKKPAPAEDDEPVCEPDYDAVEDEASEQSQPVHDQPDSEQPVSQEPSSDEPDGDGSMPGEPEPDPSEPDVTQPEADTFEPDGPDTENEEEVPPAAQADPEEPPQAFFSAGPALTEAAQAEPAQQEEEPVSEDALSFEPAQATSPTDGVLVRRPYHERYYLLYGGTQLPAHIDVPGTHGYLEALGFGGSALKQAREGRDTADLIEKGFAPDKAGARYCDFCGAELAGTEYELLSDGRERCMLCSKTAVKTAEEFRDIYKTVVGNLETFFGARITAPVRVEMVNAKKLHRRLGKSFVPTGNFDGRILGVAIKSKGGYTILVENGAPRIQSTMTIAHELIHIWQYLNWDKQTILRTYGKAQELEVYEGMAKWGEIQYAFLIGESAAAKREELITRLRQDEYGRGFCKYLERYPLSTEIRLTGESPFADKERPL